MSEEHGGIQIRILPADPVSGTYPVEAGLDDGSIFGGGTMQLDRQALRASELYPAVYGHTLFNALFAGRIRDAYHQARGQSHDGHMRVRLWIDERAPELHSIPWERLYHSHKDQLTPLTTSALTPFSRYTALGEAEPERVTERPLRLLFAIANPVDLPEGFAAIEVEEEVEMMLEALGGLPGGGQYEVTILPGRTGLPPAQRARLEREGHLVAEGATSLNNLLHHLSGCHVFHFLGHGFFRRLEGRGEGTAALYLETEEGKLDIVRDEELVPKLTAIEPLPHLVFLAACESAKREREATHPFVGLGPKLVKAGVPAVVAMQDRVPMEMARQLTEDFYQQLLEHGVVDQALNEARNYLFEQDSVDWAIPVLFMRMPDGRLFAADPVRMALERMRNHRLESDLSLPVEVVHTQGRQNPFQLESLRREPAAGLGLREAIERVFPAEPLEARGNGPQRGKLALLVGGHGTAKSYKLWGIARRTAERSLEPGLERRIIPVYVDLEDYVRVHAGPGGRLEALMLQGLQRFWPEMTREELRDLLKDDQGDTLRVLIDSGDNLPEGPRQEAWQQIRYMVRRYRKHQFLVAVDPDYVDPRLLRRASDLLLMQPLSRRRVEQFLNDLDDPVGDSLCKKLAHAQLFDLAGSPWLLVEMLDQAREGVMPESRSAVLRNLVDRSLARISRKPGAGSRAAESLYQLAWAMQLERRSTISLTRAFGILAEVRGNREYSLEELYELLVEENLLAQVGPDVTRFAYPALQAYCAARAMLEMDDPEGTIDDIAATLDRLTRLRWWEDTIVLLAGLMPDPNVLLRPMVFDTSLTEGERVFLAVRCILEARVREDRAKIDGNLSPYIVDALLWRLDSANEPRPGQRARAAEALGELSDPAVLVDLARVATEKVRRNWQQSMKYEYSNVRMAAAFALRRMWPEHSELLREVDKELAEIYELWAGERVEGLKKQLPKKGKGHKDDDRLQPIAAFALGDLHTESNALIDAFFYLETRPDTRWAVSEALLLQDPERVVRWVIRPLLSRGAPEKDGFIDAGTWKRRRTFYSYLASLIGRTRVPDEKAMRFLRRRIDKFTGVLTKRTAIRALALMPDLGEEDQERLEQMAMGAFKWASWHDDYGPSAEFELQRTAIHALGTIGDLDTVTMLRDSLQDNRKRWEEDPGIERYRRKLPDWDRELKRAFYHAREEILWQEYCRSAAMGCAR
jgi:HEAT repeat protein